MAPIISIELWRDEENGKEYVYEFIQELGPERALSVMDTIENVFLGSWAEDLRRSGNLEAVEGWPDLCVLIVEKKKYKIHFLGEIRGNVIVLVHAVEKTRFKPLHPDHYKTASERLKRVNN